MGRRFTSSEDPVARSDEILFSRSYGWANRTKRIANTPDTVFRIGSLTKAMTASAVLARVEQRQISLSEPIGGLWPDWPTAWGGKIVAAADRLFGDAA